MAALNFHKRQTRRWWYAGATLVAAALFTVFFVVAASADNPSGCDFSSANNGVQDCQGPLTGSTFAGGDGNLLTSPTAFGTTDWQNVAGRNVGIDLASGSGDNSFGQGTKTDSTSVSVVTGSIPPQKSDLTRFYEASEVSSVNSHNFLYLAFERSNVLGSANMNFEINQKAQPDLTTTGAKTLVRTAGDLLVTYDFTNGGGRPTIGILRWLTSASVPAVPNFATNSCFSANSFPCWGDELTLDGTDSIAAVNNLDAVSDPIAPNATRSLPALTFGETAIDLTAAGVFPAGTCEAFGSTMVTSRSSASFTSEVKDFIAPVPVNISNCGTVNIIKHTDPRGIDQNFSYTSTIPNPTVAAPTTPSCSNDLTPSAFTLNDSAGVDPTSPITAGTANTEHCDNVPAGSYHVTEGAEPGGFTYEGVTCTATGTGSSGSQDGTIAAQANITIAPGGVVTCTYTNQQNTATLSTSPSNTSNPVVPTTPVHDTATVVGNQASDTPGGTVTFFLCSFAVGSTATCDGTTNVGTSIGTDTLSGTGSPAGTATASSPNVNCAAPGTTGCTTATGKNPLPAGHYCFRAEWPGDSNYTSALSFDGSGECFDVAKVNSSTATTPSISTILLSNVPSAVITDHAVVSPVVDVGQITGKVKFFLCSFAAGSTDTCDGSTGHVGTQVTGGSSSGDSSGETVAPFTPPTDAADATSGNAASLITSVGRYCWRAEYSGDTKYNSSSDSRTSECFTVTDASSVTTAQNWLPNDTAEVTSGGTTLSGNVTFTLYDNATCTGNVKYTQTVSVTDATLSSGTATDRVVHTSNTTFVVNTGNNTGHYSWKVTFPAFDSVAGSNSDCEKTDITITN